jgi:hypothetical protein
MEAVLLSVPQPLMVKNPSLKPGSNEYF